jgi:hypothetical protein
MAVTSFDTNKKTSPLPGTKSSLTPWYHPDSAATKAATLVCALTGTPGANYSGMNN